MGDLINTFSGKLHFSDVETRVSASGELLHEVEGIFQIDGADHFMSNENIRSQVTAELRSLNADHKADSIRLTGEHIDNAWLGMVDGQPRMLMDTTGDVSGILHPLCEVLPALNDRHEVVSTRFRPEGYFQYLDPHLSGPVLFDHQFSPENDYDHDHNLLRYLSRTVDDNNPDDTGFGKRYTEPGVGRSFLIDFLQIINDPAYKDFSATGIGLTPYSRNGFVSIGRAPDGKVALARATNRRQAAARLNNIGCRAAKVVAVIMIPEEGIQMVDGTVSPRAILIRGFKNIVRVKQIDPIAGFYHSIQHSACASSMMIEDLFSFLPYLDGQPDINKIIGVNAVATELEKFALSDGDLYNIVKPNPSPAVAPSATARSYRQHLISGYASHIFDFARARVSDELHADLSVREYIHWFAESMGSQLALMKTHRFLHDYHHPGIERYKPEWIYTLIEHNVTLSAEFADLETAIFVDDPAGEISEALQLSTRDLDILKTNFAAFHATDYAKGERVVQALALAAYCSGLISQQELLTSNTLFKNGYLKNLSNG